MWRTSSADRPGSSAFELVVDGPERDAEGLGLGPVGGVDGGLDLGDDRAHQVHDRGEQQGAGVLPLCGPLEEGVDRLGGEGVLQGGTGHDGDGALPGESLEDVVKDHGAASLECRYLLVWRHFTRPIAPPSKPWSLHLRSPRARSYVYYRLAREYETQGRRWRELAARDRGIPASARSIAAVWARLAKNPSGKSYASACTSCGKARVTAPVSAWFTSTRIACRPAGTTCSGRRSGRSSARRGGSSR